MQRRRFMFALAILVALTVAARADDGAEKLVLATYKLANDGSTATGFAVCSDSNGEARCFVVTAHHVLAQMKGDACLLVSRERHDDGTFRRREISIQIRENGEPRWNKHRDHDLAVLRLPAAINIKALPLECLASEQILESVSVGDAVWLAVFPERSEASGAGFPIVRSGGIASYPITPVKPHPMFLVDTTSWTGDSGGPVVHQTLRSSAGDPIVLGVVRGMRNITETVRESRFVERKINYPLGITEALHAALARELIEQLLAEEQ